MLKYVLLFICIFSAQSLFASLQTIDSLDKSKLPRRAHIPMTNLSSLKVTAEPYVFQGEAYLDAVLNRTEDLNTFKYTIVIPIVFINKISGDQYKANVAFTNKTTVKDFDANFEAALIKAQEKVTDIQKLLESNSLERIHFRSITLDNIKLHEIEKIDRNLIKSLFG